MPEKILLLDYDRTLYPHEVPSLEEMDKRIESFICQQLSVDTKEAREIRTQYYTTYGTTLRGLIQHHNINPNEYFDYVQNLENHLIPPKDLRVLNWLSKIQEKKIHLYLFTNSRKDWPLKAFKYWGFKESQNPFLDIFDIESLGWEGKPFPSSYEKVQKIITKRHGSDHQVYFADDHLNNLIPLQKLKWKSLYIYGQTELQAPNFVPHHIYSRLWEIPLSLFD